MQNISEQDFLKLSSSHTSMIVTAVKAGSLFFCFSTLGSVYSRVNGEQLTRQLFDSFFKWDGRRTIDSRGQSWAGWIEKRWKTHFSAIWGIRPVAPISHIMCPKQTASFANTYNVFFSALFYIIHAPGRHNLERVRSTLDTQARRMKQARRKILGC